MDNLSKELAPLKVQISKAISAATSLQVITADDLTPASDMLAKIKTVGKMITQKKETITKPLNEALRNARAFFAPIEEQYEEAERIVKNKMLAYQTKAIAQANKKTEVIEKKVEAGTMTFEKAAEKIEAITPQKNITSNVGAAQFRTVKEVIIEDESLIPREFLVPDIQKIKKVVLAGVLIAGVKVVDKQVVAGIIK